MLKLSLQKQNQVNKYMNGYSMHSINHPTANINGHSYPLMHQHPQHNQVCQQHQHHVQSNYSHMPNYPSQLQYNSSQLNQINSGYYPYQYQSVNVNNNIINNHSNFNQGYHQQKNNFNHHNNFNISVNLPVNWSL